MNMVSNIIMPSGRMRGPSSRAYTLTRSRHTRNGKLLPLCSSCV
ncbi:hypothetical protein CDAR_63221, partial [Caerostris darwini]